jgi:GTPase SAR1 family protein
MIGQRRFHEKLGNVIIKKYEDNNLKAIVTDSNGKNFRVWVKSLQHERKINKKHNNSLRFESRKIIESLKLGGVPINYAEKFSTGRDDEIETVKKFLDTNKEGSLVITGDYGVGKTHLLELIRYHAINRNYAVSRIEIDSSEVSFHLPKNIHRAIIRNLQYPKRGKILGFRELISDIFVSKNFTARDKLNLHPYFSQFILFWEQRVNNEPLLEWFEGREIGNNPVFIIDELGKKRQLPKLHEEQNTANIYCSIISALGWITKNVLDLSGLLILIDEAESVDRHNFPPAQFGKAKNMLTGMVLVSNNHVDLRTECPQRLENRINPAGLFGKKTGLQYSKREFSPSPYIWGDFSNIKLIFSFIPHLYKDIINSTHFSDVFRDIDCLEIDSIKMDDYDELYQKICSIYTDAHGFKAPCSFYSYLPTDKTRIFVKSVVEGLDLIRFNQDVSLEELLQ